MYLGARSLSVFQVSFDVIDEIFRLVFVDDLVFTRHLVEDVQRNRRI